LVPEGKSIPSGTIAMGIPAKVVRNVETQDRERIRETADAYRNLMKKYLR
jgi:carbonic anhydrase/acetyltransferase-like protein (isoleucine patch superfamily)